MGRRPNQRQRKLQRWQDDRADATAIPTGAALDERRPLAGFESHYEVSRSGLIWSKRLKRLIKHTYDPLRDRKYVAFTVDGQRHTMSIWSAVINSWLTAEKREALRASVPEIALGKLQGLRSHRADIAVAAEQFSLPYDTVFAFLLGSSRSTTNAT